MANFACEHCERTCAYRGNLTQHIKEKHAVGGRPAEKKVVRAVKTGLGFKCNQCGRTYMHQRSFAMLSGVILIIHPLAVTIVENCVYDMEIWNCTNELVLVQLLLQLQL